MLSKRRIDWAIYAAFVVLIMLAPLVMEPFWLNRIAKYLVFGMVGVAVALSWGYAGILNLGQGLFFGAGAYMLAMSLKLASQTSLQQGSDKPVPDFMLWNAEPGAPTELCCINKASFLWLPFQNQWFGVAMGLVLPVAIAGLIGTIVFRKRISGVFVSIITLALVLLVRLVVIDAQPVTNGFNGLTDLGWFKVMGLEFDPYIVPTYYLVAVSLSLVLVGARLSDRNQGRHHPAGRPRRSEPGALSRLRRDLLSDVLLCGLGGDHGLCRHAVCDRLGIRLADLHGSHLLDHHGGVGGGRRPLLDPRRLYRRHHHQPDLGDGERNRGFRRGLESHHRPDLRAGRALPAARACRAGA